MDIRHYDDIGFSVVFEETQNNCYCSFSVYKIIGNDDGVRLYNKEDSTWSPNFEEDITKSEKFLTADIKWDGCSNWDLNDRHFCGREAMRALHKLMEKLYDLAKERMLSLGSHVPDDMYEG